MKCEIRVPEPYILRDARPGDLFVARDGRHDEVLLAILHPCAPYRSLFSGEESLIRCVVLGSRVDASEPGFASTGTLLMLTPETAIQFVVQSTSARFIARGKCVAQFKSEVTFANEPSKPGDQL